MKKNNTPSVAIIGGGPSGLIAAEKLAQAGCHVTVYERKASVGRKFLMAGRGGLNITHSENLDEFLKRYGTAQKILAPIIQNFTPDMLRTWCDDLGQETYVGSSGRVFPKSMKASPLLRAWLARLEALNVQIKRQYTWQGWNEDGALIFERPDKEKELIKPDAALLALGGGSWPDLGSDGSWVGILEKHGVQVNALKPANCGFTIPWSAYLKDRHAGQPLKNITLTVDDKTAQGEIMINTNGIEGGGVYALSSFIRNGLERGPATIHIDLKPSLTAEALAEKLSRNRKRQSFSTWIQKAAGLNATQIAFLREFNPNITEYTSEQLAKAIKSIPVTVEAPFPIDRAISSAGGISFDSLTPDLMLKSRPGVFVAGEMLDWEAPTGGYLLQACFATGVWAAAGIIAFNASS